MTCGNLVTEGLQILAVKMTDAQYIKMEEKSSSMYSEQIIVVIELFP